MALSHSPSIVTSGLVLYLDAANRRSYPGSGTTWFDLSENNNGALTNGPTFNSINSGSIAFDGNDDYATIPNGYTKLMKNNNNWTVSLWFKANNLANNPVLVGPELNQLNYYDLFLEVGSNTVYFAAGGGSGANYLTATLSLVANNIYNIVYLKTGTTTGKIYLNGNEITLSIFGSGLGSMPNTDADLRIGGFKTGSFYLNGNIYSVYGYNRTLNAVEIAQNFNAVRGRFGI